MVAKPVNKHILETINLLRKKSREEDVAIWRYVRELIYKPKRRRIAVNLSRINRYSKEGDMVIVPGKVLGSGYINHKIIIGALDYSITAKKKLLEAGCEVLSIKDFINRNPKGSGVKIIV